MTARNAAYGTQASRVPLPRRLPAYAARAAALALLLVLLLRPAWLQGLFAPFADNGSPVIYDRASLLDLTLAHLGTVALSSLIGTLVAVTAGIAVTRPAGADFLPVARSIVDIGQTFPPVAVLALAVPAVGFGLKPVLIALVLYGLLPVFESTIAGLEDVPRDVVDAARGMGMSGWQQLASVELPLAFPVIVNGIRLAVVINLGTATIGSTVAARGLGDVIIAGLQTSNTAFVLQGGVIVGLLAVLVSDAIGALAKVATARRA
ncbi:ABC transporter permease [Burkholderia pseudomultivorans]|uniref:ABC transporter permease n=1 Tax=Burkholderia pseudomultivorans TaxID=1207504 RepID=A0A6P2ITX2_9BURK|nr:ABC transporter permease [Burkholderia pseudomultivorans]MDR8726926.1 Glycine betaine uptake system permease protein YehW [Burkholderia pseudomultivorans]MDR8735895.1 Glycine betaine uptake system permease protein YehW [Burkholderia pseudomultivorans]MDR8741871.1 Glycine betaine uptake system permease protein YehW [Burkholderia pseudomultivorans]MDR8752685.1 Glycine betaine uptake system permease protein YehW [Burkholderia pseudomultivorans]MDR8778465.1 Glycine betaine uptake system permeas